MKLFISYASFYEKWTNTKDVLDSQTCKGILCVSPSLLTRICGINTGRPRATSNFHGRLVHLRATLRRPRLLQRGSYHRDREEEKDCMINSGGRADYGNQF